MTGARPTWNPKEKLWGADTELRPCGPMTCQAPRVSWGESCHISLAPTGGCGSRCGAQQGSGLGVEPRVGG